MKKIFFALSLIFLLQACTSTTSEQTSVPKKSVQQKSVVAQKTVSPKKEVKEVKEIYSPKMKAYLDKSPLVLSIRNQIPKYAKYTVVKECTLEKFISSVNATSITATIPENDQIIIESVGSKLGNRQMTFKIKNKEKKVVLEKLTVGKITQSNLGILSDTAKNLCEKANINAGEY